MYSGSGSIRKKKKSRHAAASNEDYPDTMVDEDGFIDGETVQNDRIYHKDDNILQAEKLLRNIRVLCWVMTSPATRRSKEAVVLRMWTKRCNKMIFMSEAPDPHFTGPLAVLDVQPMRGKTMTAFDYIYEHHVDDADWFLNADDGTYVVVENLRYLLAPYDSSRSVYFGDRRTASGRHYFSGGTSYVLSKKALQTFGKRRTGACVKNNKDLSMADCLSLLGVRAGDSRDELGRDRFHYRPPVNRANGKFQQWFMPSNHHGGSEGITSMSDYSVSFHNIPLRRMYEIEFLVYHLRPYGIRPGLQRLNSVLNTSVAIQSND
ncbi:Glycoprotein-N-acetylgalactosamine 3-beta-galactosyltransferase 1 [Lamellibrachia satsuma]|nr:Glycoprotein-N-acetylgalactosamine 3-beta-galactosyltransferase 1 [Lamellibrachia satsuma]